MAVCAFHVCIAPVVKVNFTEVPVGPETESTFHDDFWFDSVCTESSCSCLILIACVGGGGRPDALLQGGANTRHQRAGQLEGFAASLKTLRSALFSYNCVHPVCCRPVFTLIVVACFTGSL